MRLISLYSLTLFLSLILFSACQSKAPTKPIIAPDWIAHPSLEGKSGAVGSAMPHFEGKSAQRRLAISRALDELAQQSGVQVESIILRSEKRRGADASSSAQVSSVQRSARITLQAHIQEVWVHDKSKEMYVWLVAD